MSSLIISLNNAPRAITLFFIQPKFAVHMPLHFTLYFLRFYEGHVSLSKKKTKLLEKIKK